MFNPHYFDDIADKFLFGKHKGDSLWSVISNDESYIYWCINNIPDFAISIETLRQIRELFPMFIVTSEFSSHIRWSPEYYDEEFYDEDEPYIEEESTYERYKGSYAQDEMGYSDDDIDTIFDGDPLAYWNID